MNRSYLVIMRLDVDERGNSPAYWDWPTLLDIPSTGSVELVSCAELAPLDEFSPENETTVPFGKGLTTE